MNKNRLETLLRPPHKPASNPVGFTRRAQSKSRTNPYFGRSHKITKSELFARRLQPGDSGFHGLSAHSVPLKLSDIKNTWLNRTRTKVVFYSDELGRTRTQLSTTWPTLVVYNAYNPLTRLRIFCIFQLVQTKSIKEKCGKKKKNYFSRISGWQVSLERLLNRI